MFDKAIRLRHGIQVQLDQAIQSIHANLSSFQLAGIDEEFEQASANLMTFTEPGADFNFFNTRLRRLDSGSVLSSVSATTDVIVHLISKGRFSLRLKLVTIHNSQRNQFRFNASSDS